jgi:hypothetical protein
MFLPSFSKIDRWRGSGIMGPIRFFSYHPHVIDIPVPFWFPVRARAAAAINDQPKLTRTDRSRRAKRETRPYILIAIAFSVL